MQWCVASLEATQSNGVREQACWVLGDICYSSDSNKQHSDECEVRASSTLTLHANVCFHLFGA